MVEDGATIPIRMRGGQASGRIGRREDVEQLAGAVADEGEALEGEGGPDAVADEGFGAGAVEVTEGPRSDGVLKAGQELGRETGGVMETEAASLGFELGVLSDSRMQVSVARVPST